MKTADRITGLVIAALSVIGFIYSKGLRGDAGKVPMFIFVGLFIAGVALVLYTHLKVAESKPLESMLWGRWFLAVFTGIAYAVLIPVIGFYAASAVYLFGAMYLFGVRNKKTLVIIPAVFVLIIYLLFAKLLGIRLPAPFFM